jgi:hypothetical protein
MYVYIHIHIVWVCPYYIVCLLFVHTILYCLPVSVRTCSLTSIFSIYCRPFVSCRLFVCYSFFICPSASSFLLVRHNPIATLSPVKTSGCLQITNWYQLDVNKRPFHLSSLFPQFLPCQHGHDSDWPSSTVHCSSSSYTTTYQLLQCWHTSSGRQVWPRQLCVRSPGQAIRRRQRRSSVRTLWSNCVRVNRLMQSSNKAFAISRAQLGGFWFRTCCYIVATCRANAPLSYQMSVGPVGLSCPSGILECI